VIEMEEEDGGLRRGTCSCLA